MLSFNWQCFPFVCRQRQTGRTDIVPAWGPLLTILAPWWSLTWVYTLQRHCGNILETKLYPTNQNDSASKITFELSLKFRFLCHKRVLGVNQAFIDAGQGSCLVCANCSWTITCCYFRFCSRIVNYVVYNVPVDDFYRELTNQHRWAISTFWWALG